MVSHSSIKRSRTTNCLAYVHALNVWVRELSRCSWLTSLALPVVAILCRPSWNFVLPSFVFRTRQNLGRGRHLKTSLNGVFQFNEKLLNKFRKQLPIPPVLLELLGEGIDPKMFAFSIPSVFCMEIMNSILGKNPEFLIIFEVTPVQA